MPSVRMLAAGATACGLACAIPAAASAGALPRPVLAAPSAAHVIPTPAGKRLAVVIRVTYRLGSAARGDVPRASMTGHLSVVIRLRHGVAFTSTNIVQAAGASTRVLEHHVFFTAAQTRMIRAAGTRLPLEINAAEAVDVNGDGRVDVRSSATRSASLPAITAAAPDDAAFVGHAKGDDPCGYYGLTVCEDVAGSQFTAHHFWASSTQTIDCPVGYPYPTAQTTVVTSSNHYTETSVLENPGMSVTIIDDNIHGHPYSYQPFTACLFNAP